MKNKDGIIGAVILPRIELIGNSQCIIEGLKAIEIYSQDKIKVNLGKHFVTFFGDNLFINAFSPEGAVIEGLIVSLEFESNA